jgi:hypothetical protein
MRTRPGTDTRSHDCTHEYRPCRAYPWGQRTLAHLPFDRPHTPLRKPRRATGRASYQCSLGNLPGASRLLTASPYQSGRSSRRLHRGGPHDARECCGGQSLAPSENYSFSPYNHRSASDQSTTTRRPQETVVSPEKIPFWISQKALYYRPMTSIKALASEFANRLHDLLHADATERARAAVMDAFGATPKRRGRPPKASTGVALSSKKKRRKGPLQLCPVPGCKNPAAPVFGMVCAKHKDVAKGKIKKYREARKAKKLNAA